MKKHTATAALLALLPAMAAATVNYDDHFEDRTLRLDYILAGNDSTSAVYLEECGVWDGWAGRRHNLDSPFLRGNGGVTVRDAVTGATIYNNTFSTLFQEWQHTPEAATTPRAFESTILVPMPKRAATVTVTLLDNRGDTLAIVSHPVNPEDILIRRIPVTTAESRYVHRGGDPRRCVDIAILAEGYTAAEKGKFYADARRAAEALLSHEPFASMASKFNILAVATASGNTGPDVPREGIWGRTAHRSHYDTFYSDRYLTTQAIHSINDSLAGLPYEHIVLMVNTPRYGGGGIFNQITVATSDHPTFKQVLVHEFGHAYAGLADEYYYEGEEDTTYSTDTEPWEPNITTLVDFPSKWASLVPEGTPIPTPLPEGPDARSLDPSDPANAAVLEALTQAVGVYEGAGYRSRGVYRPVPECRMKVNQVEHFCPVCTKAIVDITRWYTEE